MSLITRRGFLGRLAAIGASAVAVPRVGAAERRVSGGALPVSETVAIETEASAFANPLRLPGASGLYGVMRATDLPSRFTQDPTTRACLCSAWWASSSPLCSACAGPWPLFARASCSAAPSPSFVRQTVLGRP